MIGKELWEDGLSAMLYLEGLNAVWAILELCLVLFFAYYILRNIEAASWRKAMRAFWHRDLPPYINAAIAIITFHIGDFVVRSNIWLWRHILRTQHVDIWPVLGPIIAGGSIIACAGLLCKIRVFSSPQLGNWPWIAAIFLSATLIAFNFNHLTFSSFVP